MATTKYSVAAHDAHTVTLKQVGIHVFDTAVVITRPNIASVAKRLGELVVTTTDGRRYVVAPGIRKAQRELTAAAFSGV